MFAALTALVLRKAEAGQRQSNANTAISPNGPRNACNIAGAELRAHRCRSDRVEKRGDKLLGDQTPVLTWWAICAALTRASATLTMLAMFAAGIWLNVLGLTSIGEIVTFTTLAGMLIARLEQVVGFANRLSQEAPRLKALFEIIDIEPAVRDRPDAIDPGRVRGMVEFANVSFALASIGRWPI
jgi:ATP-binding cassette subfamily B protein